MAGARSADVDGDELLPSSYGRHSHGSPLRGIGPPPGQRGTAAFVTEASPHGDLIIQLGTKLRAGLRFYVVE